MAKTKTRPETLDDILREALQIGVDEDVHYDRYCDEVGIGLRTLYRLRRRLLRPARVTIRALAGDLADRGLCGGDLEACRERVLRAVQPA